MVEPYKEKGSVVNYCSFEFLDNNVMPSVFSSILKEDHDYRR